MAEAKASGARVDELERVVHAEAESAKELVERRVALTA